MALKTRTKLLLKAAKYRRSIIPKGTPDRATLGTLARRDAKGASPTRKKFYRDRTISNYYHTKGLYSGTGVKLLQGKVSPK